MLKRGNLQAALYVALVFLSGIAVGVLGDRLYSSRSVSASAKPKTPDQWRADYVSSIRESLRLSDAQVTKLNEILDSTRARYREVKERYKPEMKQIHTEQVEEIRGILTDEQKPKYEEWREERDKRRKAEQGSSGGGC
jgi:Spy/CpxP family protein refolding chaperone